MSEIVLETEQLTKKYGARVVVNQMSINVERGDIFGLLGQNGGGKSTTLRMALGLVRPTSGRVRVFGSDMSKRPLAALKRVGAIIETPAFYLNFSGRQNLRVLAALSGGATPRQIEEVLELVTLRERACDPVRTYSHGMRQRLGIAQALLPNPELIILDEPTNGLDPQGLSKLRDLIRRLRDEFRLTVVLSSHLLHEVEQICNRVAIIDKGCVVYQGTVCALVPEKVRIKFKPDQVSDAYKFLSKYSRMSVTRNGDQCLYLKLAEDEIPAVNTLLVQHDFRVMELSRVRETLEEVFLRFTRDVRHTDQKIDN